MFRTADPQSGEVDVHAYRVEGGVGVFERKVFVHFVIHGMKEHERCVAMGVAYGRNTREMEH